MRALLIVVALTAPAAADVLKMRQVDSTNMHMANNAGAIHWSEDITITVDLGAKGRAGVVSKGTRGEHNMMVMNNAPYNTDDDTTWATTWKGTWKVTKDALVLDLALVKDTCSAVRNEEGTKTNKPCEAARKSAVMRCATTSVDLEVGAKKTKVATWQCTPDDERDLGESPRSWLLGKSRCIEVHAGRMMAMSFAACP